MDYTIKVGGEAGQGVQTVGGTLARLFARDGYNVFTHQDYESRVRGGHNFYQIRLSDSPVSCSREKVDIIVAMDIESVLYHEKELLENGRIIYDSGSLKKKFAGTHFIDVPFSDLADRHGGSRIMSNIVAVGAVAGLLGMKTDVLNTILSEKFTKKGGSVAEGNIKAAEAGRDFVMKNAGALDLKVQDSGETSRKQKMLIAGNDAIGFGAVASGLKFYSAYPMTPSTGILNYAADRSDEFGIIVEQVEDEIAAINMALGASFAGVRAMTGTSGGGFALMSEGLSLAGITETPLVIALAQRPGPATGLPTRTEQGDLQFALYTAHGEFPRIIFAPGTPEEAFFLTNKAFDLTEKYQVPVIIITDQYLADSQWTFDRFDLSRVRYTDHRLRGDRFSGFKGYKRHAYTETGVTPLGVPGDSVDLVVTDSDEHDEEGHMIEDAETRKRMMDKRLFKKLPLIRQEIAPPAMYGDDAPELVITGWGSTYGVMKEAVDVLSKHRKIAMLHFSEIYPLPSAGESDYLRVLENAEQTICVEHNATGQFERLVRAETGYQFNTRIHKYDGRPFTLEGLTGEINAKARGL